MTSLGACLALLVGALVFGHQYANPGLNGAPLGQDIGFDAAYLGPFREELLRGRLLTWYSTQYDGMPLLGHPLTQVFYLPLILPTVALGTAGGLRVAYLLSLFLAGFGMYVLVRVLGARRAVALWAGLLFLMSGTIAARIYAGHLEKVLAIPLVPWVLAAVLLSCRAEHRRAAFGWAVAAGLAHGATFLAGDSYLLLYLTTATPVALGIGALGFGHRPDWWGVALRWGGWATGLLGATAGKLVAALPLLADSSRSVPPFRGSQDWYWSFAHLMYPSFRYGPTLPWNPLPRPEYEHVPGPPGDLYGWYEYTQFVGVIPTLLAIGAVLVVLSPLGQRYGADRRPGLRTAVVALLSTGVVAVLWLANASWYSPVHWLQLSVPFLQQFRVPSRALMLLGPVTVALAALGLELLLGLAAGARCPRLGRMLLATTAVGALVNVYSVTHWVPAVGEHQATQAVRHFLETLRQRDDGPFLLDLDRRIVNNDSVILLELTERGVRVGRYLAPLRPATQGRLVTEEMRVRVFVSADDVPPAKPGRWEQLTRAGQYTLFVNRNSVHDAWLIVGEAVGPAELILAEPSRFVVRANAPEGATVAIPASMFAGWWVRIDDGPMAPAVDVDGYAAVAAMPGDHTYEFVYELPRLGLILVLAAAPWLLVATVIALWAGPWKLRRI